MQSLGLKLLVPSVNPTMGRARWPSRKESGRSFVTVAAASASSSSSSSSSSESEKPSSSSSFLSRSQTYALLKQQMAVAAKFEDYKEAARIRDNLRSFEAEEPVLHLRSLIKQAIEEERFEDAARYRDELRVVAPHSLLKCSSDATTLLLKACRRVLSNAAPAAGF